MDVEVTLALGSNLGDRLANLQAAVAALAPYVEVQQASQVYETAPWGITDQPCFLNQVVRGRTRLAPEALLGHLKAVEARLGRQKTIRYGPRLIDLDIIFYGSLVYVAPELTIPHPRLAERAFVLVPLAELAPELEHPLTRQTMRQMLAPLDVSGVAVFDPQADCPDEHSPSEPPAVPY
jgi:2-amino-4-hydroxy-6-hydroxymethyldihydropteridine diphosphokinase